MNWIGKRNQRKRGSSENYLAKGGETPWAGYAINVVKTEMYPEGRHARMGISYAPNVFMEESSDQLGQHAHYAASLCDKSSRMCT